MNDIHMTFDELLTMKALQFKSSLSGRTSVSVPRTTSLRRR